MMETASVLEELPVLGRRPSEFSDPPLRTSKIAIVGFATETMKEAPFDDPAYEIWILNMLHSHVPRWDRLWEMHDRVTLDIETKDLTLNTKHLEVLQAERTRPIYMVERQPDIPCSVRYPVEDVTRRIGANCDKLLRQPYFTSTFAYMLASAILGIIDRRADPLVPEYDEKIDVCGIELLNAEEYAYQRANAEFLLGYALAKGIEVYIPDRSALLESDGLYGYARSESLELLGRMKLYYNDKKKQSLATRDEAAMRRDQAKADWNTHDGAAQTFDWVLSHLSYLSRGGKV
jgi:hypothetical protein